MAFALGRSNMDKETALAKIKKCLALSKSVNEHEAAIALKQAQRLMQEYSLNELDIQLAEIYERRVSAALKLPQWHWDLIHVCGRAFGCERWHQQTYSGGKIVFCGINGRPEMAAYAYEVLLRQLKQARRQYMKSALTKVRITKNKTYRADKFCEGWVSSVRDLVKAFARTEEELQLIEQYKTRTYGRFRTAKTRDIKGVGGGEQDFMSGILNSKDVRLDVPVGKAEDVRWLSD